MNLSQYVVLFCLFICFSSVGSAQDTSVIRRRVQIKTSQSTSLLDTNEVVYDEAGNALKYYQSQKLLNTGEYSIKLSETPGEPGLKKYLKKASVADKNFAYERLKTSVIPGENLKPGEVLNLQPLADYVSDIETDNKVVVMIFWNSACPPCTESFDSLNELFNQIYDRQKLIILSITKDDVIVARAKLQQKPLLRARLVASARNVFDAYTLNAYPAFVVTDKSHVIQFSTKGMGPVTVVAFKNAIKSALNK